MYAGWLLFLFAFSLLLKRAPFSAPPTCEPLESSSGRDKKTGLKVLGN